MVAADSSGLRTYDARFVSRYANPFAFIGQRDDVAVGTHHFLYRTYLPWPGRWGQRDPRGYVDGVSLYEYVNGDPLGGLGAWGLADWRKGCDNAKVEDWIARHMLAPLMGSEYLSQMTDSQMYKIGVGGPIVAVGFGYGAAWGADWAAARFPVPGLGHGAGTFFYKVPEWDGFMATGAAAYDYGARSHEPHVLGADTCSLSRAHAGSRRRAHGELLLGGGLQHHSSILMRCTRGRTPRRPKGLFQNSFDPP